MFLFEEIEDGFEEGLSDGFRVLRTLSDTAGGQFEDMIDGQEAEGDSRENKRPCPSFFYGVPMIFLETSCSPHDGGDGEEAADVPKTPWMPMNAACLFLSRVVI